MAVKVAVLHWHDALQEALGIPGTVFAGIFDPWSGDLITAAGDMSFLGARGGRVRLATLELLSSLPKEDGPLQNDTWEEQVVTGDHYVHVLRAARDGSGTSAVAHVVLLRTRANAAMACLVLGSITEHATRVGRHDDVRPAVSAQAGHEADSRPAALPHRRRAAHVGVDSPAVKIPTPAAFPGLNCPPLDEAQMRRLVKALRDLQ
ncbi:hypothetical protein ACH41H_49970 [Streptomyces sp. NPDC020800]|uniref:hypothetical protein n=1 Tax=Streptomyces sp. NPDC020800 TaxID=3365092 RepID=UPI003793648E